MSDINEKVAVILVNWNGLQDTLECLDSLGQSTYFPMHTIVVDNNSDDDLRVINERYPETTILRNADNYGFCKGNNIGIAKAAELGAVYCWILNNDTVVSPECLGKLIKVLKEDTSLGAVAHRIDYYSDRKLSWYAGGIFIGGIPRHRGLFVNVSEESRQDGRTEYMTGCSFVARTELLQKIGGFDEEYFCYVEDVDLSLRIQQLGLGLGYVGDAVVWHKVSRTTGRRSPVAFYYRHRNMLYFLGKFRRSWITKASWYARSLRRAISLVIKHGDSRGARFLIKGLLDANAKKMGRLGG